MFDINYAGPYLFKCRHAHKSTIVKSYVCVVVSLTVKAVHLKMVSKLTTDAFIDCLWRFISRCSILSLFRVTFIGAAREIKSYTRFYAVAILKLPFLIFSPPTLSTRSSSRNSHLHNFGGLWEAAVKLTKKHLKRIVGNVKLTFEELSTVLTQIEACLCNKNWTQDIWYGFYVLIMYEHSKRRGTFALVSPMIVHHHI